MIRNRSVLAVALVTIMAWGIGLPFAKVNGHSPVAEAVAVDCCAVCNKVVYPLEGVRLNEHSYHKQCFKCSKCGGTLTLQTVKSFEGKLYCAKDLPKALANPNVRHS